MLIVFDFFGTLVNYEASSPPADFEAPAGILRSAGFQGDGRELYAVWQTVYFEMLDASLRTLDEFSFEAACQRAIEATGIGVQPALCEEFMHSMLSGWNAKVCAIAGVEDMLRALKRDRDYSFSLVTHLHRLVQAGHDRLYQAQASFSQRLLDYAGGGFAEDVRANRWWVLIAALLLFGPALAMMVAVRVQPDSAYLIVRPEQIAQFETMYSGKELGRVARDASTDFSMFGFYIFNNVSIAFRCFAGGITAGLLSAFALIFNGLNFGVVEARLAQAGLGNNFYSFIIGHSGFELGAIVLSGAAGLRLGMTLIAPGLRTRRQALRETAESLVGMVCGLAVMLVIAALIEAFWSPLKLGMGIKIGVGSVLCLLPLCYFLFAGRRSGA